MGHLGRFYQYMLDMLVALLGNGHSHHLVGRALLYAAQPAVTVDLLHRSEPRVIADLQYPGQGRNRAHSRDGSEAP